MSASLYASVGRTARQLINKFGKRMIYRQKKDGQVYNDQTMRYEPSIKDTPGDALLVHNILIRRG